MPKPWRKPSWRNLPTVTPGARSSVAILAGLPAIAALAYSPDQNAGLEIVRSEQRVGCALRIGRRIESDHEHACIARLLDGRDDRLRVARGDQNRLGAAAHHVLDGGDLGRHCRRRTFRPHVISLAPLAFAAAMAPSFIFTKNGLVSVFVMRPTTIS